MISFQSVPLLAILASSLTLTCLSLSKSCHFQTSVEFIIFSLSAARALENSLVSSKLDCCNSLYSGISQANLNKLQRIQNSLARVITNTSKYQHITPTLEKLHWLRIKQRINYKFCLLKTLTNQQRTYLQWHRQDFLSSGANVGCANNVRMEAWSTDFARSTHRGASAESARSAYRGVICRVRAKCGIETRSAEWNRGRGLGRGLGEPLPKKIFEILNVQRCNMWPCDIYWFLTAKSTDIVFSFQGRILLIYIPLLLLLLLYYKLCSQIEVPEHSNCLPFFEFRIFREGANVPGEIIIYIVIWNLWER